jgi:hypothetical protein
MVNTSPDSSAPSRVSVLLRRESVCAHQVLGVFLLLIVVGNVVAPGKRLEELAHLRVCDFMRVLGD